VAPEGWKKIERFEEIDSSLDDELYVALNEIRNYFAKKLGFEFELILVGTEETVLGNLKFLESVTNYDGTCATTVVYGCTDSDAFNYDTAANTDDGSCIAVAYGCTDSSASNYDSAANTDDGLCITDNSFSASAELRGVNTLFFDVSKDENIQLVDSFWNNLNKYTLTIPDSEYSETYTIDAEFQFLDIAAIEAAISAGSLLDGSDNVVSSDMAESYDWGLNTEGYIIDEYITVGSQCHGPDFETTESPTETAFACQIKIQYTEVDEDGNPYVVREIFAGSTEIIYETIIFVLVEG